MCTRGQAASQIREHKTTRHSFCHSLHDIGSEKNLKLQPQRGAKRGCKRGGARGQESQAVAKAKLDHSHDLNDVHVLQVGDTLLELLTTAYFNVLFFLGASLGLALATSE